VSLVLTYKFLASCDGLDCTSPSSEFNTVGETKQNDRLAKSDATEETVSRGRVDKRRVGPAEI